MTRNEQAWIVDEFMLLKAFLGLVLCAACFALTVLFAGWFLFILGPIGVVLLLVGSALILLTRAQSLRRVGVWLAVVGGMLLSGPLLYFLLAVA